MSISKMAAIKTRFLYNVPKLYLITLYERFWCHYFVFGLCEYTSKFWLMLVKQNVKIQDGRHKSQFQEMYLRNTKSCQKSTFLNPIRWFWVQREQRSSFSWSQEDIRSTKQRFNMKLNGKNKEKSPFAIRLQKPVLLCKGQ